MATAFYSTHILSILCMRHFCSSSLLSHVHHSTVVRTDFFSLISQISLCICPPLNLSVMSDTLIISALLCTYSILYLSIVVPFTLLNLSPYLLLLFKSFFLPFFLPTSSPLIFYSISLFPANPSFLFPAMKGALSKTHLMMRMRMTTLTAYSTFVLSLQLISRRL